MLFAIDSENNVTALQSRPEPEPAGIDIVESREDFNTLLLGWPAPRLLDLWNSVPGNEPVKRFENRATAIDRLWRKIQSLASSNGNGMAHHAASLKPAANKKPAKPTPVKPAKDKTPKPKPAPKPAKEKKAGQYPKSIVLPGSSNREAITALLKRPKGATLDEIMKETGWQAHSVRGFIATLGKTEKIESTKVDGNRTYRIL